MRVKSSIRFNGQCPIKDKRSRYISAVERADVDLHKQFFGRDDAETLVRQATAPEMNPTLPADYLAMMRETDPEGYASEVLGEFRQGLSLLLDAAVIDAAVDDGVIVRPANHGTRYDGAFDASGGKADAATLAISHREPDNGTARSTVRHRRSLANAEAVRAGCRCGWRSVDQAAPVARGEFWPGVIPYAFTNESDFWWEQP